MGDTNGLIVPIILAGGKGTRLWPMSRTSHPKQFLSLNDELSLLQQTLQRLVDPQRYSAPIVITNADYRFLVAEQALECAIDLRAILLEPVARNTAAAVTAATIIALADNPDCLVHILTSDHDITVDPAYLTALDTATQAAKAGRLVTFGIQPTEPSTGFGYVEAGEIEASGAHKVSRFVEKPDSANAAKMIATGRYYWNSGMFLFPATTFLDECKTLAPEVYAAASKSVEHSQRDLDFIRLAPDSFATSPNISIDYAIFEKTTLASVVPSPIQWSDLGSWKAVWQVGAKDGHGNVQRGPASLNDTTNSLVVSDKAHVVVNGLNNIAIIASADALYVGPLSTSGDIGKVVEQLSADPQTASLTKTHQTTHRPWGGYSLVLTGERFQVKRLFVKPGKRLSLQKHQHRSEHWVVVHGTAQVQKDDLTLTLGENESIYIPQGAIHRLANPGTTLLELIEVQTGSYLGEDDIIRLEDEYGRT